MALYGIQRMIANSRLSCDAMRHFSDELNHLYANEPALTNVIKMEYQLQSKFVDDMAAGKNMGISNQTMQPLASILNRPLFNPGETRKIYAEFARTGLQSIRHPYSNMPTNPIIVSTNRSTLKLLFSGNAVGKILTQLLLPSQNKFMSRKCRENITVAATQTIFALKCYKEKHGSLPSSLEELVPEFLAKVPTDDFDGKPLRYSLEKKIIYSVGGDLMDSGGEEKDSRKKALDIPFKIEF
jgi:hypothetical protein